MLSVFLLPREPHMARMQSSLHVKLKCEHSVSIKWHSTVSVLCHLLLAWASEMQPACIVCNYKTNISTQSHSQTGSEFSFKYFMLVQITYNY